MKNFTNIHVHSEYSIADSSLKIIEMVDKAKQDRQKAICLTDHGSTSGHFDFNFECIKNDIKPIFGMEGYFIDDYNKITTQKRNHLILLAKDEIGLKQIYTLNVLANENFHDRPINIYDQLFEMDAGHLIITSACGFGKIPQLIINSEIEEAMEVSGKFYDHFKKDFYLELQPHFFHELDIQAKVNEGIIDLSDDGFGQTVITTDAHYLNPDNRLVRDIYLAGAFDKSFETQKGYTLSTNYFCSSINELKELVDNYNNTTEIGKIDNSVLNKAIKNTNEINDKCKEDIFLKYEKRIPPFTKQDELKISLGVE